MKSSTPNLNRFSIAGAIAALLFMAVAPTISAHDTDIYFTDPAASGLKPNVMLVLDTSGSMNEYVSNGMTRVDHMKHAMKTIIDDSANINMGVMRFSRSEGAAVIYPVKDLDAVVSDDGNLIAAMQNRADDAYQSGSTMTTTSSTHSFQSSRTFGIRFRNVYIPRGVTIVSAYVVFTASNDDSSTASMVISADNHVNAPEYTTAANNISARAQTAAVAWSSVPGWTTGNRYYTPNIASALQAVIDNHPDWASGNAMAFTFSGITGTRQAYAYDDFGSDSPKLVVNYIAGDGTWTTENKTVVARVSQGSDDAEQRTSNPGQMTTSQSTSNPLQLTYDNNNSRNQYVGLRFQNLAVPKGATIVSAEIEFTTRNNDTGAASLTIYGQDSANAPTFSGSNKDISNRPKVTPSVAWDNVPGPAANQLLTTPNIKDIVQEIVKSSSSWVSGNSMVFIIESQGNNYGPRRVESHETAPGKAAFLRITYQNSIYVPSGTPLTRTVRTALKAGIVAMTAGGSTPIVDSLYEAALYFRGNNADFGKVRENGTSGTDTFHLRVSHPESYSGGSLSQPAGCTGADLEATACRGESITGTPTYISPVTAGCQSNHIVLLTDGEATANNATTKVRTMTGASACSDSGNNACGVTLTQYLAHNDQFSAYSGTQPIHTHTVGLNIDNTFLSNLAAKPNGDGTYNPVTDADSLINAFREIFNEVLSDPTGFVSPSLTVNAFNRLYNQNDIYFSLFSPQLSVGWPGNVKKYRLCAKGESCTAGLIMDADGAEAVDPGTSKIKNTAESYWSGLQDGPDVIKGGAGANIPGHTSRNVYTYTGASDAPGTPVSLSGSTHVVQDSNGDITKTMLGNAAMSDARRSDIIAWMRGQDVRDEDGDCPLGTTPTGAAATDTCYTENRWSIGDALHSRPVTVTYGGTAAAPITKLFVGTNDGGLRMINASNDSTNGGKEEWIIYLPGHLSKMDALMTNGDDEHIIGVDGAPTVWVVDNDKDGIIEPGGSNNDKVYLYTGMRRGGRDIYAFDVTPTSALSSPGAIGGITPKFLWRIRGGVAGDFAGLGETWSTPKLAYVRVKCTGGDPACDDNNGATLDSKKKAVLIFGGGYDPGQDHAFPTGADAMGNGVYIVDALTGSLVWRAGGTGSGAPLELAAMKYAIPSDVALLDSNTDGAVDRLYVGDTRGQIFRIDLSDQINPAGSTPDLKNGKFTGSPSSAGSDAYVFADVGCTGGSRSNHCSATNKFERRKFFYAPALVQARDTTYSLTADYDLVAIASGDREDPVDKMTKDLSIDPVHNRIYAFRDYQYQFGPAATKTTLTDDDLYDSTTNELQTSGTGAYDAAVTAIKSKDGWRVDLVDATDGWKGEKGLAEVTVFGGILYATTYIPPDGAPISAGTCPPPAEGSGLLYGLNYLTGAGAIDLDNADGDIDRTVPLGGGIPSGVVVIIREGGTNAVVGTSGGAKTGGKGGDQFGIDDSVPREPTFWFDE